MTPQALVLLAIPVMWLAQPALATEPRVRVYDDDVQLAIERRHQALSALPISSPILNRRGVHDCDAYRRAGMPVGEDGPLSTDVRSCQINALIRRAQPVEAFTDEHGICGALSRLASGFKPEEVSVALKRSGAAATSESATPAVLPGCTGFTFDVHDWTVQFIVRAVADWNDDGQPDYLLELVEFAHSGSYQDARLVVALSDQDGWTATLPAKVLAPE